MGTLTLNLFNDDGIVQVVINIPAEYAGPDKLPAFEAGVDAAARAVYEALTGEALDAASAAE
ncbi:hypothetical protein [Microbacterium sp. NPDC058389]|uniref:hypothetical protein n=1 Tax=Microbacterium sp. NPDC058389 TaxID=3346475 RepID=UPI00366381F5